MAVHEIYALIANETIKSISVYKNYTAASRIATAIHGQGAIAVRCDNYLVSEGDKYIDGVFYYNDGITQVPRRVSSDERCEQNERVCEQLQANLYYVAMCSDIEI